MARPVPGSGLGIDVSHHQGKKIDWTAVANSTTAWGPVKWVYTKASEGETHKHPSFYQHVKGASAAGLPIGAYHFARPDKLASNEAKNFLTMMEPVRHLLTLVPMIDLESPPKGPVTKGDSLMKWVLDFAGYIKAAGYETPLLYVGTNYSNKYLGGKPVPGLPIWVPQYNRKDPTTYKPDVKGPNWVNETTKNWVIWQFGVSAEPGQIPGIKGRVDLNVVRPGGWEWMTPAKGIGIGVLLAGALIFYLLTRKKT